MNSGLPAQVLLAEYGYGHLLMEHASEGRHPHGTPPQARFEFGNSLKSGVQFDRECRSSN